MDQMKIGSFIKELRKEKGLTQEVFAEAMNTSRRTISRWETGTNMPDLDMIPEIAEFFDITINELFDGRRKTSNMNELKETVLKAAEYTNEQKKKTAKVVCIYCVIGMISLISHEILNLLPLPETFLTGFADGSTFGLSFCAMAMGILYCSGYLTRVQESKMRIISRIQKKAQ